MEFLLEALPSVKSYDLESLLPWSKKLPAGCRAAGDNGLSYLTLREVLFKKV
jgi:hypothetical protein